MDTYYDVLGCDKNATYEELKRSYQNLVRIHHPDRRPQDAGFSNNAFMKIDEAWKLLKDPDKRKHYDSQLKNANLSNQPMVYETLDVADLEENKANSTYSYVCRCGGMIVIEYSEVDVDNFILAEPPKVEPGSSSMESSTTMQAESSERASSLSPSRGSSRRGTPRDNVDSSFSMSNDIWIPEE